MAADLRLLLERVDDHGFAMMAGDIVNGPCRNQLSFMRGFQQIAQLSQQRQQYRDQQCRYALHSAWAGRHEIAVLGAGASGDDGNSLGEIDHGHVLPGGVTVRWF